MASSGDWNEVINEIEAQHFVGRVQEIGIFRQQINLSKPNYLIFYITGQGGVGKTTLMNRYREIAKNAGFLLTDCDEQQRDVPTVLGRFAHQLAEEGHALKRFDERYKTYRQKMNEIEGDPNAPQGLAAMLGRTIVRAAYVVGDTVPGLRKGLDLIPQETFETQASEWSTYLAKKLTNKDEIALVRDPTPILTSLFFEELNELAKKQCILLCFENFEVTRLELQNWLLRLREYKPSLNIRIIIAGRNSPGPEWDTLRNITNTICLDVFTEQESQIFLDSIGITNIKRRAEIIECSGRLPVIMSWLAAPEGDESDTSLPSQSIVERFLRWITDPNLRQVALLASIPRIFNLDILSSLLDNQDQQPVDVQTAFDWLLAMPFVQQGDNCWKYHDVVRNMMLHYQRQKSPQTYRQYHTKVAEFYNAKREVPQLLESEQWINEQWRKDTLPYIYHFLVANPAQHWTSVMDLFTTAVRMRRSFAIEITELLNTNDVQNELSSQQLAIVQLFYQQLQSIQNKSLEAGFEMFDTLCHMANLSPQAKGYALTYRGECYRLEGKYEKALLDFSNALDLIPDDTRALTRSGITYLLMERYQEALDHLNKAIRLNEEDAWALAIRGETYRRMKQYEKALIDLNQSIALYGKNAWTLAIRGETYRRMKRYDEAISDLDQSIALNDKDTWTLAIRGETYRRMKQYEKALADLDHVIKLDEKSTWPLAIRGEAYLRMKRYQEALDNLNQAIALDNNNAWALAIRGETHFHMENYQEALKDFNEAVELGSKDVWIILNRSETYYKMGLFDAALSDLDLAINLDEKYTRMVATQGLIELFDQNREATKNSKKPQTIEPQNWNNMATVTIPPPPMPSITPPSYSSQQAGPSAPPPSIPYYPSPSIPSPSIPYHGTPDIYPNSLYQSQEMLPKTPMPSISLPPAATPKPVTGLQKKSHGKLLLLLVAIFLIINLIILIFVLHVFPR